MIGHIKDISMGGNVIFWLGVWAIKKRKESMLPGVRGKDGPPVTFEIQVVAWGEALFRQSYLMKSAQLPQHLLWPNFSNCLRTSVVRQTSSYLIQAG